MYKTNFELIDQWFESDIDLDSSKKLFIRQFGIHNNYLLSNYFLYKIINNKLITTKIRKKNKNKILIKGNKII